ncbi:hypothetical protein B0H13DRAFT_2415463 [Mycena leptocephala]|nr:hypothetical protein B0H13DRAFT_2415463 [Mycena leptocephala]
MCTGYVAFINRGVPSPARTQYSNQQSTSRKDLQLLWIKIDPFPVLKAVLEVDTGRTYEDETDSTTRGTICSLKRASRTHNGCMIRVQLTKLQLHSADQEYEKQSCLIKESGERKLREQRDSGWTQGILAKCLRNSSSLGSCRHNFALFSQPDKETQAQGRWNSGLRHSKLKPQTLDRRTEKFKMDVRSKGVMMFDPNGAAKHTSLVPEYIQL